MNYQMIAVKNLAHSPLNIEARKKDAELDAGKKQLIALKRAILNVPEGDNDLAKRLNEIEPLAAAGSKFAPNWLNNSTFKVWFNDQTQKFEVLGGSRRLTVLEEFAKAKASWLEFMIPCEICDCKTDLEKLAVIALDNGDAEESGTRLPMDASTRFQIFYRVAPKCEYIVNSAGQFFRDLPNGWTSTTYRRKTGCGSSEHVPFAALTRLGKHFGYPAEFFTPARVKVLSQLTAAYLVRDVADINTGTEKTKGLPKGLEVRYCEVLSKIGNDANAKAIAFDEFKAEFNQLLDGDSVDGAAAYGQKPKLSAEERKQEQAEKEAAAEQELVTAHSALAAGQHFRYAQHAVCAALKVPNTPPMTAGRGNALDIVFSMDETEISETTAKACAKANAATAKHGDFENAKLQLAKDLYLASTGEDFEDTLRALREQIEELKTSPKNAHKKHKASA